ncbi:MAG: RNA-directed DNA polymerase [Planctomycetales bacterium]|nr:RNA-directed DNA polymerase [Planctomycetales bacterium]
MKRVAEWFAVLFSRAATIGEMKGAAARLIGGQPRWVAPMLRRAEADAQVRDPPSELVGLSFQSWMHWLLHDRGFLARVSDPFAAIHRGPAESMMLPAAAAMDWPVPQILTVGDLAHWLDISPAELHWLANLDASWKLTGREGRHYQRVAHQKRFGEVRIIEAPRYRLKVVQRRILHGLLNRIPAHDAAHGFVAGRSTRTFAEMHARSRMVLRIDLRNFFVTIRRFQIAGVFALAGYPADVAYVLSRLCSAQMSVQEFSDLVGSPLEFRRASGAPSLAQTRRLYTRPHLPQGAPTSPMLANLCVYRLDCRLSGLAAAVGGRYSRYADDLAFSADLDVRQSKRLCTQIAAIVIEEGFQVHDRKTKRMRRGTRQRIAGVVINEHPNVTRQQYDQLKAILHNCARYGPESQNRDQCADFRAHLEGRVAHVGMLNPTRGAKLKRLLQQIDWGR